MHHKPLRNFLVLGLVANLALLILVLFDYYQWNQQFLFPLFVVWGALILVTIFAALLSHHHHNACAQCAALYSGAPMMQAPAAPVAAPVAVPTPAAPVDDSGIPFIFNGYTLYNRAMTLKNGGQQTIYFFAKKIPKSGKMAAKPDTHHVGVNERTGLPFLKKGKGKDGEDLTPEIPHHYQAQCGALTDDGKQCRNSSRIGSKYCASHFGYQPPSIAKAAAKREDTLPKNRKAKDTLPSVRRKTTDRAGRA